MKIKKLFTFFLIIINIILLSGCGISTPNGGGEIKKLLPRPYISLNDDVVKWSSVQGATSYEIFINDNFYCETTETQWSIDLSANNFPDGKYQITVKAIAEDTICNSPFSIPLIYTLYNNFKVNELNIIAFNDTHGAIFTNSKYSGMDKVATICNENYNQKTLLKIANGDMFQGTYLSNETKGLAMVEVLNEMSIDAFVIGNHEFDWGIEEIARFKDGDLTNGEADFPFLAANILKKSTSERLNWTEPYIIKKIGNLTIGIIGLIGKLESSINTEYVDDYVFTDPLESTKKYAYELRNIKDCDIVIASIHDYEESYNSAIAALKGNYKIDALITGHTHQKINTYLGNDSIKLPVIQSNTKNYSIGNINFLIDDTAKIASTPTITHLYPSDYDSDEKIMKIYDKYQSKIFEGEVVINNLNNKMSKSEIAKIVLTQVKEDLPVDIAIINTGAIRTTFNKGPLLIEDIYEAMPFDNEFYIIRMPGSALKNFITYAGDYLATSQLSNVMNNKIYNVGIIDYVYNKVYYNGFFTSYEKHNSGVYLKEVALKAFKEK